MLPVVRARDEHGSSRIELRYHYLGRGSREPIVIPDHYAIARATRSSRSADGLYARPERRNHVVVPRSDFGPTSTVEELLPQLFGRVRLAS